MRKNNLTLLLHFYESLNLIRTTHPKGTRTGTALLPRCCSSPLTNPEIDCLSLLYSQETQAIKVTFQRSSLNQKPAFRSPLSQLPRPNKRRRLSCRNCSSSKYLLLLRLYGLQLDRKLNTKLAQLLKRFSADRWP